MSVSTAHISRGLALLLIIGLAACRVRDPITAAPLPSSAPVMRITADQIEASVATKVLCELDMPASQVQVGATITVQSSEGQREEGAVGLQHCSIP